MFNKGFLHDQLFLAGYRHDRIKNYHTISTIPQI